MAMVAQQAPPRVRAWPLQFVMPITSNRVAGTRGSRRDTELRSFDAHVGTARMHGGADGAPVVGEQPAHVAAERIGETHVHHHAVPEESRRGPGAVEELIRYHHVERPELFTQTPHGAGGEHVAHAQGLHAPDIGAVVHLTRGDAMTTPVARQERDRHAVDLAYEVHVARLSERRRDAHLSSVLEQLVEAGAAYDADQGRLACCSRFPSAFSCADARRRAPRRTSVYRPSWRVPWRSKG